MIFMLRIGLGLGLLIPLSVFAMVNEGPTVHCAWLMLESHRLINRSTVTKEPNEIMTTDLVLGVGDALPTVGLSWHNGGTRRRGRVVTWAIGAEHPAAEYRFSEQIRSLYPAVSDDGPTRWLGVVTRDFDWALIDLRRGTIYRDERIEGDVVAAIPDVHGRYVALNIENDHFLIWSTQSREVVWDIPRQEAGLANGAFDRSGKFFITVQASGIGRLWDVPSEICMDTFHFLPSNPERAPAIAVSPYDGNFKVDSVSAVRNDTEVEFTSSTTLFRYVRRTEDDYVVMREQTFVQRGELEVLRPVAYGRTGTVFIGGPSGTVEEYDTADFGRGPLKTLTLHRGDFEKIPAPVENIAVAPTGDRVAASLVDGAFAFWDLSQPGNNWQVKPLGEQRVSQLLFNGDVSELLVRFHRLGDLMSPRPSVRVIKLGTRATP